MVKTILNTGKEISKLVSCRYLITHYGMMHGKVKKRLILTIHEQKNDGFWLLWGIFNEYIEQNIIMTSLILSHPQDIRLGLKYWTSTL